MSLKKLTESIHKKAEQTKWSKALVSGDMTCEQYGQYIYNLLYIYSVLETKATKCGIFKDHPNLKPIQRILPLTLDRGWFPYENNYEQSTHKYVEYLETCDREQILAHMYVRHFGDMYGGQIIAKNVPRPDEAESDSSYTEYFNFENKSDMITIMRSLLSYDMADEAILGFQFAINLFADLEARFDL